MYLTFKPFGHIIVGIIGGETMIDIKFLRENPDIVKQNIKNKFQDQKLILVDDVKL